MADQISSNPKAGSTAHRVQILKNRIDRLEFRIKRAEDGNDPGFNVDEAKAELEERQLELQFMSMKKKRQEKDAPEPPSE